MRLYICFNNKHNERENNYLKESYHKKLRTVQLLQIYETTRPPASLYVNMVVLYYLSISHNS